LVFTGEDYRLLWAIENSTARCEPLGLLVEHRGSPVMEWEQWQGELSCNDCEFDAKLCTVSLNPASADRYQKLLDNWEKEYNLLLTPGNRQQVTAELATLAAGISIEWRPVSAAEQGEYVGTDGWTLFLQNRSWIEGSGFGGLKDDIDAVFRYRLRNVPMVSNGRGGYTPEDKSGAGWQVLQSSFNTVTGTVDYVKSPAIAGFKTYKIGTYNDWNDPRNEDSYPVYGDQLLLIDGSKTPADYGYVNLEYIEVTGPGGWNSPPDECPSGLTRRVRRYVDDEQCSRLFWRFGNFKFGRCFRLIDGLYSLLQQTVLPFNGGSLLPPTAEQLSEFLTASTNPATGQSGLANEVPRLLLSAASDVKRYGASEAATRVLISLKQFLSDLSYLYDGGWFVDPATGWLRFEHRSYLQRGASQVDLRELEDVLLSSTYNYRTQQLPRYEDLVISNASTEDTARGAYFAKASLDYGLSACINTKEGSNRTSYNVGRLTGDVTAGVLNGDQVPDNALFLLAPDGEGRLAQANREVCASSLLFRYYRRGRPARSATVEGPAPLTAPNTVTGTLPVTGTPAVIESERPAREQGVISGRLASLASLVPTASYVTNLTEDGELAKAVLTLRTRDVKLTIWLPRLAVLNDPPEAGGRQFDDSFSESFT